ncbi:DNA pilot protein [Dipodfec virus RodF1_59]|uniref:DNA pilot protein n=1 Tax=Dipodfec virus RodF1_59 TaxID=2929304 RepID=A0A976N2P6_9VIRU|nr:DNA pilot protein [Dipodfec virus RodF1_59]
MLAGSSAYNSAMSSGRGVATKLTNNSSGLHSSRSPLEMAAIAGSGSSAYEDLYSRLQDIQAQNNAWSAQQAQRQMDFQSAEGAKARQFNHDEAELNRTWQEYMSSTAHQREIKDLSAAGLNPVLSAMGGSGAPVTSGATASGYSPGSGSKGDTDTSLSSALVGLFSSMLQSQTALTNQAVSAQNNLAVAEKYTSMQKLVTQMQNETQLTSAGIYTAASRYAAQVGADATKVAASIHAAAQKYGYDLSAMTQQQLAAFNAQVNKDLANMGYQHDFDIHEAYPNNMYQLAGSLAESIFGHDASGSGLGKIGSVTSALKGFFSSSNSRGKSVGGSGSRSSRPSR